MSSTHLIGPMKHFVKGSEEQKTSSVKNDDSKQTLRPAFVSGAHVKRFYEQVVGEEAFEGSNLYRLQGREGTNNIEKQKSSLNVPFNINTLLKAVETGNIKEVERILAGNEDKIDSKDQYGWTPIMSACCTGDCAIVESLLKWHPQIDIRDKRGNTCHQLASARGHSHIVEVLKKYSRELANSESKTLDQFLSCSSEKTEITPFYCKTCKQSVENTSLKKHLSSTIHNFNAASKKKMPTMYGIPESNKGFQILLKSGWDKEAGLGPSGEGHKFPPKTILKQDRTGLGAKKYKPRVTHSVEDARREAKPKDTFKRKLISQKRKEQRLERNLRQMLS